MSTDRILAFTASYWDRFTADFVNRMRGSAGIWYDHMVCLGAPSPRALQEAQTLLEQPDRMGIQYLLYWEENRGQHWAFKEALRIAREKEYKWLLRLDDDIYPKSKRWLKHMIECLEKIKEIVGDPYYRLVAAPYIKGLNNPLKPIGVIEKGQKFDIEIMAKLGGACRLHPVELLEGFEPDIYAPIGRGDPEAIAAYLEATAGGRCVRLPGIRVSHPTSRLEAMDSPEAAHARVMGHTWPWLGEGV